METFDIVVRYKKDALQTVEDLESLLLSGARGPVPLSEIAEVIDGEGPITIIVLIRRTSATIRAKVRRSYARQVTAKIADTISDIDVPDGYSIDIGGMSELMEERLRRA